MSLEKRVGGLIINAQRDEITGRWNVVFKIATNYHVMEVKIFASGVIDPWKEEKILKKWIEVRDAVSHVLWELSGKELPTCDEIRQTIEWKLKERFPDVQVSFFRSASPPPLRIRTIGSDVWWFWELNREIPFALSVEIDASGLLGMTGSFLFVHSVPDKELFLTEVREIMEETVKGLITPEKVKGIVDEGVKKVFEEFGMIECFRPASLDAFLIKVNNGYLQPSDYESSRFLIELRGIPDKVFTSWVERLEKEDFETSRQVLREIVVFASTGFGTMTGTLAKLISDIEEINEVKKLKGREMD